VVFSAVFKIGERTLTRTAFGFAGIAAALLAAPASAHHSLAIFDSSKVLYVTGTVRHMELVNPHVRLHLLVRDDKGGVASWSFEGGSVAQLAALGWSRSSFRVGDRVEIGFRPMRDGSRGGQILSVRFANG
jgi:hypothetical protein